mgnify:CR=1 FL=1
MPKKSFKKTSIKAAKSLGRMLPFILGIIALLSLLKTLIPKGFYVSVFKGNILWDSLIGSLVGSISAGNPLTSYVIGGELLKQNVSLTAVTAFIVAWVTVGIIQIPAEMKALGKKFTIVRNISAFVMAIVVAVITVFILNL